MPAIKVWTHKMNAVKDSAQSRSPAQGISSTARASSRDKGARFGMKKRGLSVIRLRAAQAPRQSTARSAEGACPRQNRMSIGRKVRNSGPR